MFNLTLVIIICSSDSYIRSYLFDFTLIFSSYLGGSITGIDATAFDTVFCPPSMNMPPEGGTGGIAASNSTDLKWAGGGLPHCQLDVNIFQ